jgi:hypothetical protein
LSDRVPFLQPTSQPQTLARGILSGSVRAPPFLITLLHLHHHHQLACEKIGGKVYWRTSDDDRIIIVRKDHVLLLLRTGSLHQLWGLIRPGEEVDDGGRDVGLSAAVYI